MATFSEAFGNELRSGFCTVLGGVRAAQNLARPLTDPFPAAGPFPWLYQNLCNQEPPPTEPPPPFLGGQCPISYQVTITSQAIAIPGSGVVDETFVDVVTATGPIGGVTNPIVGNRIASVLSAVSIPIAGGASTFQVRSVSRSFYSSLSSAITNITPNGSGVDNCGNPPPLPIPPLQPGDNVFPTNINYINNDGDTTNIPINIIFGYANISPTGNFNFPISLDFPLNPELNIDGNYNPSDQSDPFQPSPTGRGTNPSPSPADNLNPDSTLPDDPLGDDDPGIPDPVTPENPEYEEVLVGCIVRVTSIAPNTSVLFQGDNPDIFIPNIGTVNFRYRIGKAGVWSEDFPVKNANQFIPVPPGYTAIDVRGTPRFGSQFTVTAVRDQRQINPAFP